MRSAVCKAGVSVRAAQAEMDAVTSSLAAEHPDQNHDWGVRLVLLRESLVGGTRPVLLILLATVALVLVIACANIANLQLARAASRRREMAIRSAMGASARDVLRQLLVEGSILAFAGGLLGVVLAKASLGLLAAWSAPGADRVRIDGRVLLFTLAVSAVTGLVFGLVPAFAAAAAALDASSRCLKSRRASCSPASAAAPRACRKQKSSRRSRRPARRSSSTSRSTRSKRSSTELTPFYGADLPGRRRGPGDIAGRAHFARHARRYRREGRGRADRAHRADPRRPRARRRRIFATARSTMPTIGVASAEARRDWSLCTYSLVIFRSSPRKRGPSGPR